MNNTVVAIAGGDTLTVDVSGFDQNKSLSLKAQHAQEKMEALEAGYSEDRTRVLKAFDPVNIEAHIRQAMREGKSSFTLDLGKNPERTEFWQPKGPLSKKILRELNRELRSSSMLTKTKYHSYDPEGDSILYRFMAAGMSGLPVILFTAGVVHGVESPFVGGLLLTVGNTAIMAYPQHLITKYMQRNQNNTCLKVSFKNPNKPWGGIPGRAMTALSVAAVGVKNMVLSPFRLSTEKAAALKSEFADNFRKAAQQTLNAAQRLSEYANDNGLEFSARVDDLTKFANRQIEIIESRSYERATLPEKRTLLPLVDLLDALEKTGKMVTIQQGTLSELAQRFDAVVSGIEANVRKEESEQSMNVLSNIDIGLQLLVR